MADGYPVIVKINLPPGKQYQQGHSLIVQGASVEEVEKHLDTLAGTEGNGKVILAAFAEEALKGGVEAVLSQGSSTPAAAPAAPAASDGDEDPPATLNQLKVLAKKTGTPVEELEAKGLTTTQVKSLLKEAK